MAAFVKVAKINEIEENSAKLVEAEGKSIALIRAGGNYYALDNTCTHVGGPLCEGTIGASEVTCPWHGTQFNLKTGEVLGGPARSNIAAYAIRVEGEDIEIEL